MRDTSLLKYNSLSSNDRSIVSEVINGMENEFFTDDKDDMYLSKCLV